MKEAILFASLISLNNMVQAETPQQANGFPVEVVEVEARPTTITRDLPGRISAFRTAEVRARVTGIIEKRIFKEGSIVNANDILFKIEDKSLKATLRARSADVANAIATYNLSKQTLKRYADLLKLGAVSRQEHDTYAAETQQARAKVEQAKANQDIAKINLDYATVTAPITGRIDQALVTEGALTVSGSTKLAIIEQIDKVYVNFTRSSAETSKIRRFIHNKHRLNTDSAMNLTGTVNPEVEILFDDETLYEEKGRLEFSSMSVDETTGSTILRAIVNNPQNELLPGMFVRVKLPVADADNVIKIPQKAVQITQSGAIVHMVKDKKLITVPVVLGPMSGELWIVISGLTQGDRVVVSDVTVAKMSGMPIVAMTAEEMAAAHSSTNNE